MKSVTIELDKNTRPKCILIGPCLLEQDSLGYFLGNRKTVDVLLNTEDVTLALDMIASESPDIVILDDEISQDTSKLIMRITGTNGGTHLVLLARRSHHSYIYEALNAGACAYVEKSKVGTMELESIIKEISHSSSSAVFLAMDRRSISDLSYYEEQGDKNVISDRELEIIKYVAEGYHNKEIAKAMSISEQTAKAHIHNVFQKLDAKDRAQAVAICFRKKLMM